MNLQESIRRILKEETSLSIKLKNLIDNKGIDMASTAVGGIKNVAKILNLDLDDVDTQEMLVKNFIYHTKVDQIDVSFIEVRSSGGGGKDCSQPNSVPPTQFGSSSLMSGHQGGRPAKQRKTRKPIVPK